MNKLHEATTIQKMTSTTYIGIPNIIQTILINKMIKFKNKVKNEISPLVPPKTIINKNKINPNNVIALMMAHLAI